VIHTIRNPLVILTLNLMGLMIGVSALTYLYIHDGFSAKWVLLALAVALFISQLFFHFQKYNKRLVYVIKALANGDSTLGLPPHDPMLKHYENIKKQVQSARFNAEQQAQFLHALLVHIDLAVLVCDANGVVIESNPAAAKLLGLKVEHLSQLDALGRLILNTEKGLRSSAQWQQEEQLDTLSIQVSVAHIQGKIRKVITLHSIREALLIKEQQAYKRLTQVLIHEVANSITPLASIAQTCHGLIPDSLTFEDEEDKEDLSLALNTLASRTAHLGEFIQRFRSVSSLPKPTLTPNSLKQLLEHIIALHHSQLQAHKITYSLNINATQLVMFDHAQIEQVLINLFKNAIEAINNAQLYDKNNTIPAMITVTLGQNRAQQVYVDIADTGPGVAEHVIDMIFVPFFTTKPKGSGIGLSLSRQIMMNHGGDLRYINLEHGGCFRCVFG
jgi:nitrogen fixation/metabolism regulation signal transduction histidine kinase